MLCGALLTTPMELGSSFCWLTACVQMCLSTHRFTTYVGQRAENVVQAVATTFVRR